MKIVVSLIVVSPKFREINCFSCPVERPPPPTESLKWYSPICDAVSQIGQGCHLLVHLRICCVQYFAFFSFTKCTAMFNL